MVASKVAGTGITHSQSHSKGVFLIFLSKKLNSMNWVAVG